MKTSLILFLAVTAALSCGGAAEAASSPWQQVQGGRVRLVTTGLPDAQGNLRGAVDIDLAPGWKTYWRDPGDAGVPPQIDLSPSSNVSLVEIGYPTPRRFDEEGTVWVGYEAPVRFPLTLKLPDPSAPAKVDARLLVGICKAICIPLQARLSLDPRVGADNAGDAATVADAFASLPAPARPGFGVAEAEVLKDGLVVRASLPESAAGADLFVAAPQGYSFGQPRRQPDKDGKAVFTLPLLDRPATAGKSPVVPYTLAQGGSAVSGTLPLP
jgi:DsbC/DsbD-like thiol-disulfide interchange protein